MEGLGEFFGARVAGRLSPVHIDRVAPALPAPMGERLWDARYSCTDGFAAVTREPSPSRPTGCVSDKGDRGLGRRDIAKLPYWVSAISLRRQEEFCRRVAVHQETVIVATFPFQTT